MNIEELESHADVLLQHGDYKLARNIFKALLGGGYDPAKALFGLARTYEGVDDFAKARKLYEESISFRPTRESCQRAAKMSSLLQDPQGSVAWIGRALSLPELTPEEKFSLFEAGGTYAIEAQQYDQAEQWIKEALRSKPSTESLYLQLGTLGMLTGRTSMSKKAYELALVVNARSDRAWAGLGALALKEKNTGYAYDCFLKALDLEVRNPPALFYLVRCAYELKRYAEAEAKVRSYCDVAPVNPNLLYSLAGLQFHLGKFSETLKTLESVLRLRPNHAGALELKSLCSRYG